MGVAILQGVGGKDLTLFHKLIDRSIAEITEQDLDGLTVIGNSAFYGCNNIENITIPDSVTSIGNSAFDTGYRAGNLIEVRFSSNSGLTSIGDYAFRYQWKLKKFICPATVTALNGRAFYGCEIVRLIMLSTSPATISSSFAGDPKTIYVPYANIDDYKSATNWTAVSAKIYPLVSSVLNLNGIDTTVYTKACVAFDMTTMTSYEEYVYQGNQWVRVE